jgi:hypothetical protein
MYVVTKNIVDMARNDGREDLSSLVPLAERVIELVAQNRVRQTGGTVCTCGTGNTVPAEAHDHDCAIFTSR